jgi:uncharacterized repeat protein (TIGR02543 family)
MHKPRLTKFLSVLVVVAMCLSMLPAGILTAFAESADGTIKHENITNLTSVGSQSLRMTSGKGYAVTKPSDTSRFVESIIIDGATVSMSDGFTEEDGNGDWGEAGFFIKSGTVGSIKYTISYGVDSWGMFGTLDAAIEAGVSINAPLTDADITFVWNKVESSATRYSITAVTNDSSKGTVDDPIYSRAEGNSELYYLNSTPNIGYGLDYWEYKGASTGDNWIKDDNFIGQNPYQVTIDEDRDYRAVFAPAKVILGDTLICAPVRLNRVSPIGNIMNSQSVSQPVFAGQRARISLVHSFGGPILNDLNTQIDVECKLYAGDSASGTPLKTVSGKYAQIDLTTTGYAQTRTVDFDFNIIPKLSQVTVSAKFGELEEVVKTYDIAVLDPVETIDLNYLSSPTTVTTNRIYDTLSFIDSKTGKLTLYAAAGGGLLKLNESGTGFAYVSGLTLQLSPNTNEYQNGKLIALGGTANHIIALAHVFIPTGGGNGTFKLCAYEYTPGDGTWTEIAGSVLDSTDSLYPELYQVGVVFSGNDIWSSKAHWNGSSWTAHGYTFNSIKKVNDTTAYAGSTSGLYKYSGSSWSAFSTLTGTATVLSVAPDSELVVRTGTQANNYQYHRVSASGTATLIDTSGLPDVSSGNNEKIRDIKISDGSVYALVNGRLFISIGTSSYYGTYIYKQTANGWEYCEAPEFFDEIDLANPDEFDTQSRMDGVCDVFEIAPGTTLLSGYYGAYYLWYGNTTVTFEPNNGGDTVIRTGKIGSPVTLPETPALDGQIFTGWYYTNNPNDTTAFDTSAFPAKNLTVYARWSPEGGVTDPFASQREAALSALDAEKSKYNSSDYEASEWELLVAAYEAGIANIGSASSYPDIQNSLNAAISAMAAVPASNKDKATVAVSVEKFTLGQGYIIEPTLVTVPRGTQASIVITDLIDENLGEGFYKNTGTPQLGFYLAAIKDTPVPNDDPPIPQHIRDAMGDAYNPVNADEFLGEFDYYWMSGWMFCVNNSFPNVGSAAWPLNNGDVMRWQFTLYGYGADLDADNSEWGSTSLKPLANKDKLTWRVAEINAMSDEEKSAFLATGDNQDYFDTAMEALTKLDSTQVEVDAALMALGGDPVEPTPIEKNELNALIAEAEQLKSGDYTEESWTGFTEALQAAKTVTAKEDATQEEVDNATAALSAAKEQLVILGGKVSRIAGNNRYDTSAKTALQAYPEGAETVIIARGDDQGDFADALAASYLAGVKNAPILLVAPGSLPQEIADAIKQLGAKKAYVLGGELAVSQGVENKLKNLKLEVERITGNNRYATAAAIAARGGPADTAIVVSGTAPADSLVAGPLAFSSKYPILLVEKNSVPAETKQAIADLGITKIIVIGGENAVSRAVYNELKAQERYAGHSRIETSLDVAEKAFAGAKDFSIVGYLKLADAVGAAVNGDPIIYVKDNIADVKDYLTEAAAAATSFTIFGGPMAVNNTVEDALQKLLQ